MTLLWIAPWAIPLDHSRRIQYIEMDASFKAVRPYCFVAPLGVIGNCGLPLGLVVTPIKKAQSYHMFYDVLIHADPLLSPVFDDLPILSDLGSGLAAFANTCSKHHFLCYRHPLERLGSRTFIAIFVR
jgi:hypothetical protein